MSPTVAVSRRRLTLATAIQIGGRVLGALLGVLVAASLAREFRQLRGVALLGACC